MKNKVLIILLLLLSDLCNAQNLISNGDFELYHGCPNNFNQLDSTLDWFNPSIDSIGGSPDYYNQCANGSNVGIPLNSIGYQLPFSGNAFAGIYLSQAIGNVREYIEVPISPPLTMGCYHFEMQVNLGNKSKFTTDVIGAYFSDTLISGIPNPYYIALPSQVNNISGNAFDSLNWTPVSGNYFANGGESYLIIGNFKNDSLTPLTLVNQSTSFSSVYVFIDHVVLTPCTGINNLNDGDSITIYPNPFHGTLNFQLNNYTLSELILYDITSRNILQSTFIGTVTVNTEPLEKGIYFYEIRNKEGYWKKGKILKE